MKNQYKYLEQPKPYQITMGTYKAHFRGKPQDYWETTYFDFFSAIFVMVFIIAFYLAITVLLVDWVFYYSSYSYGTIMSTISAIFVVIFLILNWDMSRGKRKRQKQIMKQAIKNFRQRSGGYRDQERSDDRLSSQKINQTQMDINNQKILQR